MKPGRLPVCPARLPRRGLALLALLGALMLVSRASGAGWVVVLLCCVASVLVMATIWPVLTLVRIRVELIAGPRDATARSPATFSVLVRGAGSGVRLRIGVDAGGDAGAWVAAFATCQGDAVAVPSTRGIVTQVTAELEAADPIGLVSWRRRFELALVVPLEVGPAPTLVQLHEFIGAGSGAANGADRCAVGHDTVRGVRAYVAGDPIRIVHWPATARWGEVMVKEMEDPAAPELVIVVDLRGRPERTESAASLAAGLARAAMELGLAVSLHTAEADGPRSGLVTGPVQAGRRLARAVADACPSEPPDEAGRVFRVTAT
jgi:uncharacterized protein (DUF58 family)